MNVALASVNALQHADEIKDLFRAHGRAEFPEYFDRAYPAAFADGATSWVGRDPAARIVMHIALFRRRFSFGGRDVVAGLLGNLMVATPYRAFFPALKLLQRLVQDANASGAVDFLYADPNEDSRALLRGTRFRQVGALQRHVLPLGGRLFHAVLRGLARVRHREVAPASSLVPVHDRTLYQSRLRGFPSERDWWFSSPQATLLVRGPGAVEDRGLAVLYVARWSGGSSTPWALLREIIAELRRRGCARLQITTVAESSLARALKRCGFIPRNDTIPLFAYPFTPLGEACIAAANQWEITDLDCDR